MKKTLILSLGFLVLMVLIGCTKPLSIQQKCEFLNANAQLSLRENHDNPSLSQASAIYYEDTASYSVQNDACYESNIREVKPIKWFEINKIIFNTGEKDCMGCGGTQQVLFSGYCLTNENIWAYSPTPEVVEQAKKGALCIYTETGILAQYHNKIQELIGN